MRPRLPSQLPDRLRAEDGLGLVEVLVAILLLTIGVVGLLGGFNSARSLTLLSERHTTMAHRAQLEIERLQSTSTNATTYSELAMTSAPSNSSETTSPDYYVNTAGTEYEYGAGSTEKQKLVIATATTNKECTSTTKETGCGVISPTSPPTRKCTAYVGNCEWTDGALSGDVYDFITSGGTSTTSENYKRLTVVVTLNVPRVTPLRVSTLIAEP